MAETFQELKKKLTEFYLRIRAEGELEAGFNRLSNAKELREITEALKECFPRQPTLGDEYTMYFAYGAMDPEARSAQDKAEWWKYTKRFINHCPEGANLAEHLKSVISRLPEMGASTGETFNYGLRALKLLPKEWAGYSECVKAVEKMGRNDFRNLLEQAMNESDYQKKLRAFDRALARLPNIPFGERYKGLDQCIQAMVPIYHQTEWGKIELPRKRKLASSRIFKSLPKGARLAIHNRKHYNDWLSQ